MKSKVNEIYQLFNKAIYKNNCGSYGGRFPMPFFSNFEVEMVIGKFWMEKFLETIKELKEQKVGYEEIANKIRYPSYLTRAIIPNPTLKFLEIDKKYIEIKDKFIAEIIFKIHKNISLCKQNKNVLWTKKDIKKNFDKTKLIQTNKHPNGYLRTITEFLYFYSDNLGHEFHGPYILPTGKKLLVRKWYNLNPPYYSFSKNFKPNELEIFELYSQDSEIEIDISNRLNIENQKLEGMYFKIGDKILNKEKSKRLSKYILKKCEDATKEISKLTKQELFEKACIMQFYMLKPLTEMLNQDWRPSKECMERIKQGIQKKDKILYSIVKSAPLNYKTIKILFDYRLDLPKR